MTKQKSLSWLKNIALFFVALMLLISILLFKFPDLLPFYKSSEDDIFEATPLVKESEHYTAKDLSDITNQELQQKNIDFFYRVFMQNQVQINDIQREMINLRVELSNYRNSEKIVKIIFAYLDLRSKIFNGIPADQATQNQLAAFRLMIGYDNKMINIFNNLDFHLKELKTPKELKQILETLIPELVASSKFNKDAGFIEKIRYYLAKKIVIRKINHQKLQSGDVDSLISSLENHLNLKNYIEALQVLAMFSGQQKEILKSLEVEIKKFAELQQIDEEFLNYLKNPQQN